MHGFSTVDGFMDVKECLGEMIKYVANEPSVGLYFVQQHTQNAVPNLIHLKDKVVESSREVTLHTEDLEDSICAVRSMKDCGFIIADEMIKDIKKSFLTMSTSQPKKGLIRNASSSFQMGRSSSWRPAGYNYSIGGSEKDERNNSSYLSTVLNSAKQRAAAIRWPQIDSTQFRNPTAERFVSSPTPQVLVISAGTDLEVDELPVSSSIADEQIDEPTRESRSTLTHDLLSRPENYEKFKSDQEAKLEEWLDAHDNSLTIRSGVEANEANPL
ncbi:MEF2BNB-like protein [Tasmannia lanceolata]|uniref:MEF2BNB-like protein n=1 Tax=Tasmannia lanceolata TaxID=3420 RepID=UPI00406314BF